MKCGVVGPRKAKTTDTFLKNMQNIFQGASIISLHGFLHGFLYVEFVECAVSTFSLNNKYVMGYIMCMGMM